MPQYIDKDALVAEIEKLLYAANLEADIASTGDCFNEEVAEAKYKLCKYIIDKNNTLEVKEVNLEKEYKEFVEDDLVYSRLVNNIVGKAIAKHFFELGLNTRQNISLDVTDIDKVIEENGVDPNSKEAKMFKESYYMALEKLKAKKGE